MVRTGTLPAIAIRTYQTRKMDQGEPNVELRPDFFLEFALWYSSQIYRLCYFHNVASFVYRSVKKRKIAFA
jgi:hypothetical protein